MTTDLTVVSLTALECVTDALVVVGGFQHERRRPITPSEQTHARTHAHPPARPPASHFPTNSTRWHADYCAPNQTGLLSSLSCTHSRSISNEYSFTHTHTHTFTKTHTQPPTHPHIATHMPTPHNDGIGHDDLVLATGLTCSSRFRSPSRGHAVSSSSPTHTHARTHADINDLMCVHAFVLIRT